MDMQRVKESFYAAVTSALKDFAATEENKDVYAIAFDCDSSVGVISIRYANEKLFQEKVKDFDKYAYMYEPYGKYGLYGYKYSVGEFGFIDWQESGEIKHFLDSCYYYLVDCYYGDGEPIKTLEIDGKILNEDELKESISEIWEEMIVDCIERLKNELTYLNTIDDFIIFMCDHDISLDEFEDFVRMTVDDDLFEKLKSESYIK